jgi:hypothetical protein
VARETKRQGEEFWSSQSVSDNAVHEPPNEHALAINRRVSRRRGLHSDGSLARRIERTEPSWRFLYHVRTLINSLAGEPALKRRHRCHTWWIYALFGQSRGALR